MDRRPSRCSSPRGPPAGLDKVDLAHASCSLDCAHDRDTPLRPEDSISVFNMPQRRQPPPDHRRRRRQPAQVRLLARTATHTATHIPTRAPASLAAPAPPPPDMLRSSSGAYRGSCASNAASGPLGFPEKPSLSVIQQESRGIHGPASGRGGRGGAAPGSSYSQTTYRSSESHGSQHQARPASSSPCPPSWSGAATTSAQRSPEPRIIGSSPNVAWSETPAPQRPTWSQQQQQDQGQYDRLDSFRHRQQSARSFFSVAPPRPIYEGAGGYIQENEEEKQEKEAEEEEEGEEAGPEKALAQQLRQLLAEARAIITELAAAAVQVRGQKLEGKSRFLEGTLAEAAGLRARLSGIEGQARAGLLALYEGVPEDALVACGTTRDELARAVRALDLGHAELWEFLF